MKIIQPKNTFKIVHVKIVRKIKSWVYFPIIFVVLFVDQIVQARDVVINNMIVKKGSLQFTSYMYYLNIWKINIKNI